MSSPPASVCEKQTNADSPPLYEAIDPATSRTFRGTALDPSVTMEGRHRREASMAQAMGLDNPGVVTRAFYKLGERMFGAVPTPERLMARRMPMMLALGGLYGAIEYSGTVDARLRALLNVQVAALYGVPY
jgi:hypothetical protein